MSKVWELHLERDSWWFTVSFPLWKSLSSWQYLKQYKCETISCRSISICEENLVTLSLNNFLWGLKEIIWQWPVEILTRLGCSTTYKNIPYLSCWIGFFKCVLKETTSWSWNITLNSYTYIYQVTLTLLLAYQKYY